MKKVEQCGITQLKPRTKVVGGKNSAFGAWPWQVLLFSCFFQIEFYNKKKIIILLLLLSFVPKILPTTISNRFQSEEYHFLVFQVHIVVVVHY